MEPDRVEAPPKAPSVLRCAASYALPLGLPPPMLEPGKLARFSTESPLALAVQPAANGPMNEERGRDSPPLHPSLSTPPHPRGHWLPRPPQGFTVYDDLIIKVELS